MTVSSIESLLKPALDLWWLRPENGLALASYVHFGVDIAPEEHMRAADFACGDGITTFFKCGGRFVNNFDVFGKAVAEAFQQEIVSQDIDVFDHFNESYKVDIAKAPKTSFEIGTDLKSNLLNKAQRLGFYGQLIEADLMDETSIEDESLDMAYCNALYYVKDPGRAAKHIIRKLKPGGMAIFDVFTDHKCQLDFGGIFPETTPYWHNLLNRGRQGNNPGLLSEGEWTDIFNKAERCTVSDVRDIFPSALVRIWNVGLRPLFPVLNRMANNLNQETRSSIKEEWVSIWLDLLSPILDNPKVFHDEPLRLCIQYVLEKK